MKGRLTALAMTMALVLLAVSGSVAAKVLFEDQFKTFDPAWGVSSEKIHVDDGKLIINGEPKIAYNYLNQAGVLPNDMEATFTMSFIQAEESDYGSGFLFWARDYGSWYCLLINPNGWFAVQHFDGGHIDMPVPWHDSDAAAKGEGRVNYVKLITKGDQATIFINDEKVTSFTGFPPRDGSLIGFRVVSGDDGANSVAFSDLKVVQP